MPTFTDNVTRITAAWLNRIDAAITSSSRWVIEKGGDSAIMVDTTSPTYTWRDIEGVILPDQQGANAPTLGAFIGGSVRRYFFSNGDKVDCEFHIPHDYVPGTDLFLHYHWSHNGTGISGTQSVVMAYTYCKGHRQSGQVYGAEKTITLSDTSLNITDYPRYGHFITEGQITIAGGSATQIDTNQIEVDGVLAVNLTQSTIPTITGGSIAEPVIFFIDLHYQSSNIGTKGKAPSFYS